MDETSARQVLSQAIGENGGLTGTLDAAFENSGFVMWLPGDTEALMDGKFTPAQMTAVAWWISNMG